MVRIRHFALATALTMVTAGAATARAESTQESRRDAMKQGASGESPKAEAKAEAKAEPAPPPALPAAPERTDRYVQHWLKLPPFSAARLPGTSGQELVQAQPGRMLVVVFLASWCEPCQQLMPDLQRLEKRFRQLNTDVAYVFTHDTRDDASGFMKEFSLDNGYLANYDVLKTFHNPELPTIYVGDRRGWLTTRYVKAGTKDLAALSNLLENLTAY